MSLKLLTLDTETSGVDVENDRIITCFLRAKVGDTVVFERNWVIDPGVEIPEGASEIHGMTTEWVRENGRKDVAEAILEISEVLGVYAYDFVVVGYNASFDLAILNSENNRHWDGANLELENAATTYGVRKCKLCKTLWQREFVRGVKESGGLPPSHKAHGTRNGYNTYGCRCGRCTAANREHTRRRAT